MSLVSGSLQFCDGFDTWWSINDLTGAGLSRNLKWTGTGATGSTGTGGNVKAALVSGGRQGTGQFVHLGVLAGDVTGIFDARIYTTFASGAVSAVSDGAQICAGFNANLGLTGNGMPTATGAITTSGGYCRVFGFTSANPASISAGATANKVTFYYNMGTNSFAATIGTGTPPGGTGTPATTVATGTPSRNPWQQWTYFEMRCYRSALSGSVDLWIENSGGTMDHLLGVSGLDTGTTTRGVITGAFLAGGFFSQSIWYPVAYDDFWMTYLAAQTPDNVVGTPSYVWCLPALAESTQSGAVWTASSGSNNATVVAEIPMSPLDYTSALVVTGGIATSSILFTQTVMPYTPASIAAIQATVHMSKVGSSGTSIAGWSRIRKGATDYDSSIKNSLSFTSGTPASGGPNFKLVCITTLELDPDTGAAWNPATANTVLFGPAMSGSISATGLGNAQCACYGAYMFMIASIAIGTTVPPGGPASGLGQPFWIIQTG